VIVDREFRQRDLQVALSTTAVHLALGNASLAVNFEDASFRDFFPPSSALVCIGDELASAARNDEVFTLLVNADGERRAPVRLSGNLENGFVESSDGNQNWAKDPLECLRCCAPIAFRQSVK